MSRLEFTIIKLALVEKEFVGEAITLIISSAQI
jgi:hypothetical protein